jgi:uncharacterized spore protein YtfJ
LDYPNNFKHTGINHYHMSDKTTFDAVLENIKTMVSSNTLLSDPIEVGDRSIYTISSVGFGFAGGEGKGEDGGSGSGAGAGITPVAVMIIHKNISGPEGIQIYSLKEKGKIAEAISTVAESLPSVIGAIKEAKKE